LEGGSLLSWYSFFFEKKVLPIHDIAKGFYHPAYHKYHDSSRGRGYWVKRDYEHYYEHKGNEKQVPCCHTYTYPAGLLMQRYASSQAFHTLQAS